MSAANEVDMNRMVRCSNCEGEGGFDSGGVTPWDAPIGIPCGCCNGSGEITLLAYDEWCKLTSDPNYLSNTK